MWRETAGVVFHDCSLTVTAQIQDQLPERAVVQDVVADDAVPQFFVNDAVGGRPDTAAVIVPPNLQVIGATRNATRALQPDLRGIVCTGFRFFPLRLRKLPVMLICWPPKIANPQVLARSKKLPVML